MMSENNMTVIALESDSDSGQDPQQQQQGQPPCLPTSSNSNPDWMQHWSEALRLSSHTDLGDFASGQSQYAGASGSAALPVSSASAASNSGLDDGGFIGGANSEEEEKLRLVAQIAELQSTLDDLSHRVETVKEENLKLSSENRILGQYIENLMAASSVFAAAAAGDDSASPKARGRRGGSGHSSRRYNKPQ